MASGAPWTWCEKRDHLFLYGESTDDADLELHLAAEMQIREEQRRAEQAAKQQNNERGWQSVLKSKPLAVPSTRRFNIPNAAPPKANKRRHHRAEGTESAQVIAATEGARHFGEASKMLAKERSHRQARVKEHRQNQQQILYDKFMLSRLQEVASDCDQTVKKMEDLNRAIYLRTKNCYFKTLLMRPARAEKDVRVMDSEQTDYMLRQVTKRSQFSHAEVRSMYINCRKHSVGEDHEVVLDRAQFGRIMACYGYTDEKMVQQLFEMFDDDG